jgi:hypothetical protein
MSRIIDLTNRDDLIEAVAVFLCRITRIEPIDSLDGSSNWWLFHEMATNVIADLEKRNFLKDLSSNKPPDATPDLAVDRGG